MTDQDPFARAGQPGEPANSAGPAPRDGSASAGVRYESPQHDAPGHGAAQTPAEPWRGPSGGDTPGDPPGGTTTMPRTEQPAGPPGSPWGHGPYAGGWGQSPSSGPPSGPPPTSHWPTGGSGGGGGRRRRSPLVLVSAALAALLVAGGVGGVVGYEAASAGSSGGGSSVLAGNSGSSSSPGAAAPAGSVEAVAQKVLPSVVQLRGPSGEGSGIIISADGLILTNAHVLEAGQQQTQQQGGLGGLGGLLGGGPQQQQPQAGTQLQAVFQNGQTASVQVVGTDTTADLAVVRAQGVSNLTPVALGDSSQLQVGQEVVAVGSPLGLSGTVTSGIVSALQRPVATGGAQSGQATVIDAVQTDAAINPGNSGGALVDMNGRVIGITSAIASLGSSSGGGEQQSGSIGLGFAIPINQAKRIGDQLVQQGFANQAVLGVGVAQDQQPGTSSENGATIGSVSPGGPAANAGLKAGDVVTKFNDRVIDDGDSLVAAVRAEDPGAQVTLTVQSQGQQPRQVPVTLGTERAPSR